MLRVKVAAASVLLVALVSLAGCVGAINQKEAEIHYAAAHRFDLEGDYLSARDQYLKALVDAKLVGASAATISMLMYNYGRTAGYTCQFEAAEKYLTESLDLERTVSGPQSGITSMRIFELARYYFDRGEYAKSASFYAQGIPVLEKTDFVGKDPIAVANMLDEYATAAAKINAPSASDLSHKALLLRQQNPGKQASFAPVRYQCRKQ